MCSPLEWAGKEGKRVKEREKGEPYTRIPDMWVVDAILLGTQASLYPPMGYTHVYPLIGWD